jgi:hypothetical protein
MQTDSPTDLPATREELLRHHVAHAAQFADAAQRHVAEALALLDNARPNGRSGEGNGGRDQ